MFQTLFLCALLTSGPPQTTARQDLVGMKRSDFEARAGADGTPLNEFRLLWNDDNDLFFAFTYPSLRMALYYDSNWKIVEVYPLRGLKKQMPGPNLLSLRPYKMR